MDIREQEIFLRLTLKWIMQTHFFLWFNLHSHSWEKEANEEYGTISLGEVYDTLYGNVEEFFLDPRDRPTKLDVHNIRIWMVMYEQWCDARLASPPSDNTPIVMDETIAERYVSEKGWSLEAGRKRIEGEGWWGIEWKDGGMACRLSDLTRDLLRRDYPQFAIK